MEYAMASMALSGDTFGEMTAISTMQSMMLRVPAIIISAPLSVDWPCRYELITDVV